jgi:predicted nucleic acid-binding protein
LKIVADASVLIALSTIRQLPLLVERFPQGILIPQAVWREVVEQGGDRPGVQDVAVAPWITVLPSATSGISQLLQAELEEGEAEAIALAHALSADLVLLDERDARQAASPVGVADTGRYRDFDLGKTRVAGFSHLQASARCTCAAQGKIPD